MREYRFQATQDTQEALRRLRGRWTGYVVGVMSFTVHLDGGDTVRIEAEPVDVEGVFDAYRITAAVNAVPKSEAELNGDTPKDWPSGPIEIAESFVEGGNDIVLFAGASWSEPAGANTVAEFGESATMNFSGHPGQISETAEIVCITTDAFVVASSTGDGLLVRTGLKPESLEVVSDMHAVRAFLTERGYADHG